MSTLSKFESTPAYTGVCTVTFIDGRQAVLLPENVRVDETELAVVQEGSRLTMKPVRRPMKREQVEQWVAEMNQFQEELGDLMPEGRNQPPMPEPTERFRAIFGIEDVEG